LKPHSTAKLLRSDDLSSGGWNGVINGGDGIEEAEEEGDEAEGFEREVVEAGEAAERGLYAIPVGGIRGADSESTAVRWFVLC
jgi:hypothetical protein